MEIPRLFALLLMVLEWARPGLPSPLRPICDQRVLNHYIQEAQDAETAMAREQAQEVQSGLWLLNQAISSLRASVTNAALHSHIDGNLRNIVTIGQVLRTLSIQEYVPPASGLGGQETWRVSSASDLFHVHVNFLRGKVQLLLSSAPVCQQNVR